MERGRAYEVDKKLTQPELDAIAAATAALGNNDLKTQKIILREKI